MKKLISSYKDILNKKNMVFFLFYFFFFVFNGPLENLITLNIKASGFSEAHIGIFMSVLALINIISPTVISLFSSRYDYFVITLLGLALSLAGALLIGLAEAGVWIFLLSAGIIYGRYFINYSIGNKISFAVKNGRSKFFAVRDLFLFGGISLGGFISSLLLKKYEIRMVYLLFAFAVFLPLIMVAVIKKKELILPEKQNAQTIGLFSLGNKRSKIALKAIMRNRTFMGFVLVKVLTVFYGSALAFLPILATQVGFSISNIMSLISAITIANCIISFFLAYLADIKNKKLIYILDILVDAIPAIIFIASKSPTLFLVGYICVLLKDSLAPISFSYYFDCLDGEMGELFVGMLDSVGNVLGFLMPALIGFLWTISYQLVFAIGLLGIIGSAACAYVLLPEVNADKQAGD